MKIVDCSHPIRPGQATYQGGMAPEFSVRSTFAAKGRMSSAIALGIHTATHLDAPLHFIQDGLSAAELPLERVMGMATLIDVSNLAHRERVIDTQAFLEAAQGFPVGDIAVIYTGADELFGTPAFSSEYRCLSFGAVRHLLALKIRALVVDTVSVDLMDQPGFENHKALLSAGIPLVECVHNVLAIGKDRFFFAALPLKLVGLEGSPCRAIACPDLVVDAEKP